MEQKLSDLLRRVLDLPDNYDVKAISREKLPEWDSLRHIKVMLEIQKAFGVKFSGTEIMQLASFSDLYALLKAKIQ